MKVRVRGMKVRVRGGVKERVRGGVKEGGRGRGKLRVRVRREEGDGDSDGRRVRRGAKMWEHLRLRVKATF